jgi:hypothetical protein
VWLSIQYGFILLPSDNSKHRGADLYIVPAERLYKNIWDGRSYLSLIGTEARWNWSDYKLMQPFADQSANTDAIS